MRPDCDAACLAKIEAETNATVQLLSLHAPGLKWAGTMKPYILVRHSDQGYKGKSLAHFVEPLLPHLPMSIGIHWNREKKGWESRFNDILISREVSKTPEEAVDTALTHAKKQAEDILGFCKTAKETP